MTSLTGAKYEGTGLPVHGEVGQHHGTPRFDGQPHGVGDVSVLRYPEEFVGPGDGVEVGVQPVVEVSVRLPDLFWARVLSEVI